MIINYPTGTRVRIKQYEGICLPVHSEWVVAGNSLGCVYLAKPWQLAELLRAWGRSPDDCHDWKFVPEYGIELIPSALELLAETAE